MKQIIKIQVLLLASILALLVMFLLPLFSTPACSLAGNTLSDLGAQSSPNAWIMNFVFLFLAAGSVYAGWDYYRGFVPHRIFLIIFAVSLSLAAFFRHEPVTTVITYNVTEAGLHEYFMSTASLSFALLSIATGLIPENLNIRPRAIAAGISVILLSVMMSEADQFAGIWQRLSFIISFGWLICTFRTKIPPIENNSP